MPSSLLRDRDEPSAASSHLAYDAPSAPLISVRGLQGKECAVCSAKNSRRSVTLPHVHIGQFRQLIICRKGHLTKEHDSLLKLEKIIDREMEEIKKNGDRMTDEIIQGSEGEEAEGAVSAEPCECYGFSNLSGDPPTRCFAPALPLLWIQHAAREKALFFLQGKSSRAVPDQTTLQAGSKER